MKVEDFRVFVNSNILPNLVPGIETKGQAKSPLRKASPTQLHVSGCTILVVTTKKDAKMCTMMVMRGKMWLNTETNLFQGSCHGLMTLISFLCSKMRLFTSRMNARLRTGIYQRTMKQVKPRMFIKKKGGWIWAHAKWFHHQ